jgi:MFS family permease
MIAEEGQTTVSRITTVVLGVGLTSLIGWGTSFAAIAVLGSTIARDLGLSRELVFGGITVMLAASGLAAPRCGRLLDQEGPRRVMSLGSVLIAVSLALMSQSRGVVSFWAAWAIFGVAVPLAMSNASVTSIAQLAGPHGRRAITGLTIIAGLTSFFFLPITGWLEARYGWRGTLAIFAALHLIVCLPIHLGLFAPRFDVRACDKPANVTPADSAAHEAALHGILPPSARQRAFWLIVLWSCCEGMLVWGLNMQAIDLLKGYGLAAEAAIAMWMFSSLAQSTARVFDFAVGYRIPAVMTAVASAFMAPLGFIVFKLAGSSTVAAGFMAICYGLGHGLFVVARNVLPLRLFGLKGLGETMGRLSLPQNIVNAVAPIMFAAILSRYGADAALLSGLVCALASLAAVTLLYLDLRTSPNPANPR